jgi:hypothetical protein
MKRCVPHGEGGIGGWKRRRKRKLKAVVESNRGLLLGKLAEQLHRPWLLVSESKSKPKSNQIALNGTSSLCTEPT